MFICSFLELLIMHRGTETVINESAEVVSMGSKRRFVNPVVASLKAIAAAAGVGAAAVLG